MKKTYRYDVKNLYVFKHPSQRVELLTNSHKRNMTTIALASSDFQRFSEMCGSEAALCAIARAISASMKAPPSGLTWSAALRSAIKRAAERELRAQQAYAAELNAVTASECY